METNKIKINKCNVASIITKRNNSIFNLSHKKKTREDQTTTNQNSTTQSTKPPQYPTKTTLSHNAKRTQTSIFISLYPRTQTPSLSPPPSSSSHASDRRTSVHVNLQVGKENGERKSGVQEDREQDQPASDVFETEVWFVEKG